MVVLIYSHRFNGVELRLQEMDWLEKAEYLNYGDRRELAGQVEAILGASVSRTCHLGKEADLD